MVQLFGFKESFVLVCLFCGWKIKNKKKKEKNESKKCFGQKTVTGIIILSLKFLGQYLNELIEMLKSSCLK